MVFDVRCLPNPHYDPKLRPYTGRDEPVIEFCEADPGVQKMLGDIRRFVEEWLPCFDRDSRSYLTVAHRLHRRAPSLGLSRRRRWPPISARATAACSCATGSCQRAVTEEHFIFPLGTVLFPGGTLPLKIFEQRYIEMTKACLRGRAAFRRVPDQGRARSRRPGGARDRRLPRDDRALGHAAARSLPAHRARRRALPPARHAASRRTASCPASIERIAADAPGGARRIPRAAKS